MTRKFKIGLIAFVLLDLFLAVTFVTLYQLRSARESQESLRALGLTIYPESRPLDAFALTTEQGETFTERNFTGSWNFVFFGFTSCPDICPLTMSELKQFYSGLNESEQAQARIIMVSVDPARDTTTALAEYVDSFHPDFVGLTGDYTVISQLAAQFFVAHSEPAAVTHEAHESGDEPEYLIEHSGHLAIVNPAGEFVAVMRSPVRDQDLTRAFAALLTE